MNETMPRTPFSTPLSGSAREAELRIRNIFVPKKRPPAVFIALVSALCLLCGNLVSCQQRPAEPSIVMETQYYDDYGNYLEIPMLALPAGEENEAVDAINAALSELGAEYENVQYNLGVSMECVLYPSTTDRYINLVFFEYDNSYGNDGNIRSWVYDKKECAQVTMEDTLALAGIAQEDLFGGLEELIAADPEDPRSLLTPVGCLGFRIKADGKPVFYLYAYVEETDAFDAWARIYVWEDGAYTRYSCMVYAWEGPPNDRYPLVPAEETDQLSPPLWNQWYFAGEAPEGGFVDKSYLDGPHAPSGPPYVPGEDPYGNNFYSTLLSAYWAYVDEWNVYYQPYQSEDDKAGDLRLSATYLGEIPWGEDECAAAYQVCYTFYVEGRQGLEWHANFEDVVLSRNSKDGDFTGLLGRVDYEDQMHYMSAEEIIQLATEN